MKKLMSVMTLLLVSILTFTSCHSVSPDADEEAVLVKKPWFNAINNGKNSILNVKQHRLSKNKYISLTA